VLSACEGLDDEHRGTAVPADERGPEGGVAGESLRVVRGTLGRRLMKQFTRRRDVGLAVGVGEQSIVADARATDCTAKPSLPRLRRSNAMPRPDEGNPRAGYVGIHRMISDARLRQPRDG
jgi:hypothetical protein